MKKVQRRKSAKFFVKKERNWLKLSCWKSDRQQKCLQIQRIIVKSRLPFEFDPSIVEVKEKQLKILLWRFKAFLFPRNDKKNSGTSVTWIDKVPSQESQDDCTVYKYIKSNWTSEKIHWFFASFIFLSFLKLLSVAQIWAGTVRWLKRYFKLIIVPNAIALKAIYLR